MERKWHLFPLSESSSPQEVAEKLRDFKVGPGGATRVDKSTRTFRIHGDKAAAPQTVGDVYQDNSK